MPYVNIDGADIFFEIYGEELSLAGASAVRKPTLLVLHGGPGFDHTYEIDFLNNFSSIAQVIFLDHRGNGRSVDENPDHWNLAQWGSDVFQFCEALKIQAPFVIGDSFGGHVLLEYAVTYPGHARGLILVDTEAKFSRERLLEGYEKLGGTQARAIAQACFDNPTAENFVRYAERCRQYEAIGEIPDSFFKYCIMKGEVTAHYFSSEIFSFDYIPRLDRVASPVLVLASTENPVHSLESAKEMADAFESPCDLRTYVNCAKIAIDAVEPACKDISQFIHNYA